MNESKLGGPRINLGDTNAVKCEMCGYHVFEEAVMLREVSPLLTGTGQKGIIPVPVFTCHKCGHVNEQFLPVELQNSRNGEL